ncbi:13959_t:CDS:2 [Rhizophagus irregularis]|nr:13959_t:CDS:2 [Rhizophagus irregularis]
MTDEETKYLIDQRMFRNEVFWGLSSKLNENTLDLLIGIATFEEVSHILESFSSLILLIYRNCKLCISLLKKDEFITQIKHINLYDDNPTITLPNTLTTSKIYIPIIKIISNTIIITTDDDEIPDDYYPISIDDDTVI